MEYLYLEDGRADDDYRMGRLDEFERRYYEEIHGIPPNISDPAIDIRRDISRALSRIDRAIQLDPGHAGIYDRLKSELLKAEGTVSICINDCCGSLTNRED